MWAHLKHLSHTVHKNTDHGVSTRALPESTQRLTLHRIMANSSVCGALSEEWRGGCLRRQVCQNNSGLMLLATSFYVKNRCFHSVHNSTPYEMFFDEWPNLSEMSSVCTHRGQEETGQQGLDGNLSRLLEQEQVFYRVH